PPMNPRRSMICRYTIFIPFCYIKDIIQYLHDDIRVVNGFQLKLTNADRWPIPKQCSRLPNAEPVARFLTGVSSSSLMPLRSVLQPFAYSRLKRVSPGERHSL